MEKHTQSRLTFLNLGLASVGLLGVSGISLKGTGSQILAFSVTDMYHGFQCMSL